MSKHLGYAKDAYNLSTCVLIEALPGMLTALQSLRYKGIVLMRSQMKRQIEAPNLEVGSHMSCDIYQVSKGDVSECLYGHFTRV